MNIRKAIGSRKRTSVVFSSENENEVINKLYELVKNEQDENVFYYIEKHGVVNNKK